VCVSGVVVVVVKVHAASDSKLDGVLDEVQTATAAADDNSSELKCGGSATTEDATATTSTSTSRTTFDELMQALSELEADDSTLPLTDCHRRAPSWRE